MRNWTENQLSAITARGGSVIVSAAAGSGKTAVLVERCMRLLTDPDPELRVDADRLLVVTYTRAAAAELRERLSQAIGELIRSTADNADLIRQQRLLARARISTVDSFCSSLAREYFYLLDIDRGFRVADDGELSVLRADAMRLTLDSMYAEGDRAFHAIVETFATAKDDSRLEGHILKLYDFVRSHPFPKKWMDEKLGYYSDFTDASTSVWGRVISAYTADALDYMESLYERGYDAIMMEEKLSSALGGLFEGDRRFLDALRPAIDSGRWDDVVGALDSFAAGRFTTPRGYADNPFKMTAASARAAFRKVVAELKKIYAQSETMCLYDVELLKGYTEQIFRAVTLFDENYSAMKKERALADYPDLEHWAIDLLIDGDTLAPTDTAREISRRFDYIMVDEYQDANETQDAIFSALSRNEENLFVVGDVKQSIYGFRHAMPELFLRRKDRAVLYDPEKQGYPAKIILEKNFRSEAGVLAAVNDIFKSLMSPSVGDIEYNEEEALYPGAEYEPPQSAPYEINIIDKEGVGEEDPLLAESRFIAERIHEMISEGYRVKAGDIYRPAEFGDFAVLLRNFSTTAPVYAEQISRHGIPVSTQSDSGFLGTREIMLMTNFLRVINDPALDIELLSVMMSPAFGFNEDDMARIRVGRPKGSLYSAVIADSERGGANSRRFLKELAYYRGLSATVPLSQLITTIYERSSYLDIMTAVDRASAARDNLRILLDHARSFEQNTHKGLSSFVGYLDRLNENGSDLAAARRGGEIAEGGVRIMSIHSSKGLEFPVVILANTYHRFVSDATKAVLLHPEYGYAQKRFDPALSASFNTMPRQALAMEISRDEKSEELRVLYVALTRAKQKLIVYSTPRSSAASYLGGISEKLAGERDIAPYVVRSAGCISDWLVMCAMLHPDGAPLREYAQMEVDHRREADYRVTCRVIDRPPDDQADEDGDDSAAAETPGENTAVIDELSFHAGFVYRYEEIRRLPVKVAASTLAHRQSGRGERFLDRPAFLSDDKLTAAEKGTALHEFMQFADFKAARTDICAEAERLVREGYLTRAQADSLDTERAAAFLRSPLVDRALKAERLYKEYRFTIRVPAVEVSPELSESFRDETLVLQGAVDLAFVEDSRIVIVDYKTDRVKRPEELIGLYSKQLELYKNALEQCIGLPVKECIIYSIRHGVELKLK